MNAPTGRQAWTPAEKKHRQAAADKSWISKFWWSIFGALFAGGVLIQIMPAWLLGVIMVIVVFLVTVAAIVAGVRRGNSR